MRDWLDAAARCSARPMARLARRFRGGQLSSPQVIAWRCPCSRPVQLQRNLD